MIIGSYRTQYLKQLEGCKFHTNIQNKRNILNKIHGYTNLIVLIFFVTVVCKERTASLEQVVYFIS